MELGFQNDIIPAERRMNEPQEEDRENEWMEGFLTSSLYSMEEPKQQQPAVGSSAVAVLCCLLRRAPPSICAINFNSESACELRESSTTGRNEKGK